MRGTLSIESRSMTYATKQDMIDYFGENEMLKLTDRTKSGSINDHVLDLALRDAADFINSYLAQVYVLPLQIVAPQLVKTTCDVARYNLHTDLRKDPVKESYRDAVNWLTELKEGTAALAGAVLKSENSSTPDSPMMSGGAAVFTSDSLEGF